MSELNNKTMNHVKELAVESAKAWIRVNAGNFELDDDASMPKWMAQTMTAIQFLRQQAKDETAAAELIAILLEAVETAPPDIRLAVYCVAMEQLAGNDRGHWAASWG